MPDREELSYQIERWSDDGNKVEELRVRARNLIVARAAFFEEVRLYPKANITLRQGAHVIEESPPLAAASAERTKILQMRPPGPGMHHNIKTGRRKFR